MAAVKAHKYTEWVKRQDKRNRILETAVGGRQKS